MMPQVDRQPFWLPLGFIGVGILARLVPHPWNVTPVMAIALFGGTYLSRRWAILLPLAIVAASDLLIGWHNTVPFTWGAFVLTGALAWWIRSSPGPARIFAGSLSGSTLFFLLTNFGVWVNGDLYPRTAEGLWRCYVAAIPFFRNALIGDLIFTAALFGGYALAAAQLKPQKA
jgi:hypothetical protein